MAHINSLAYDSEYYKHGNYAGYLQRADRYAMLALEVKDLVKLPVLDFGCAVGFLVGAFAAIGHKAVGFDISDWAIDYGTKVLRIDNLTSDWSTIDKSPGTLVCLDVLEHMELDRVHALLGEVNSECLLARIPVSDGEDFVLDVSRRDATHVSCMTKREWEDLFVQHGYHMVKVLQGQAIWDSVGVLSRFYAKSLPE